MAADWAPLVWLVALSIALLLLTRWLGLHVQGLGLLFTANQQTAMLLHYLLLFPGILLHELSHIVAAALVGVKARDMSLGPKARRGGNIRFGAVTVTKSDPFRESWIGAAPLLSGTVAILLLARWRFGVESPPPLTTEGILQTLLSSLRAPDALLGLYAIFVIGNSMWPSESDRQPWGAVLLFLVLAAGLVYIAGLLPQLLVGLKDRALSAVTYVALAFGLAVSVDIPFALLILLVEKVGERLLGRHVEY
jgi:hypothetical protein